MDSSESPVYGAREHSAYNGYFGSVCYHPLFLFNRQGDCLAANPALRDARYYWLLLAPPKAGASHPAAFWSRFAGRMIAALPLPNG